MSFAFVSLAGAMLVAASLFVIWPLRRLAALDEPDVGKEVQVRSRGNAKAEPRLGSALGWVLSVLMAVASIGIYGVVGEPKAWLQPELLAAAPASEPTQSAQSPSSSLADQPGGGQSSQEEAASANANALPGGMGQAQIEAMVQRLAQRLEKQPDDAAGWRMLARSYETLRRFDDAVLAYQKLISLAKPEADVLVDYAVALGMSKGQTLSGEPEAVLAQVLAQEPGHPQALALSGSAAFEGGDYTRAIGHWRKLLAQMPAESDMRASIQANIDRAKALQADGR